MPTRSAIFAWLSPSKYARRRSRRSRVQDVEAVPEQDAVLAELVALLERTVAVELAVLAVHDLRDADLSVGSSSSSRRGILTGQARSRRCRLISPSIVGIA